jgi:hypothetical protein
LGRTLIDGGGRIPWQAKLRTGAWEEFTATKKGAQYMMPILMHMIDEEGNSVFGIAQEKLDQALAHSNNCGQGWNDRPWP